MDLFTLFSKKLMLVRSQIIIYRTTKATTSETAVHDEWVPCFDWLIP
jgi:hypothetical protein